MSFVRQATHAGDWYPVGKQLNEVLEAAFYYTNSQQDSTLKGILAPHSCYTVSLKTAVHAYSKINPDNFDTVYILGTCHHVRLSTCYLSAARSVETPFGSLDVNTKIIDQLIESNPQYFSKMTKDIDEAEHSLELQFPLIKYVFKDKQIQIVPILVGTLNLENEKAIASVLSPLILQKKALFIISSDFIHFGELFNFTIMSDPSNTLTSQLEYYDKKCLSIISEFNPTHFRYFIDEIRGSVCGCYGISLILNICQSNFKAQKYYRSELSEIRNHTDFSISYIAIGFSVLKPELLEEENP